MDRTNRNLNLIRTSDSLIGWAYAQGNIVFPDSGDFPDSAVCVVNKNTQMIVQLFQDLFTQVFSGTERNFHDDTTGWKVNPGGSHDRVSDDLIPDQILFFLDLEEGLELLLVDLAAFLVFSSARCEKASG